VAVGTLTAKDTSIGYNETVRIYKVSPTSAGRAIGVSFREAYGYELKDSVVIAGTHFVHDISQLQTAGTPPTDAKLTNVIFQRETTVPDAKFRSWNPDNYGQTATITCLSCQFVGASATDVKAWAIGQPTSTPRRRYTLFINNTWKIYNDTTRAVIIETL
jgi:hypothetical protein